jgi:hypothetical protein
VIRRRGGLVTVTLLLAAVPAGASGQERRDSLARDSVTYILEPIEVAVERERAAPPPVGALTLDPAAVRGSQASNPYQLIREVAGIAVHEQGQGPGYASNVSMRGFTSDHSSDVLLVIDGVPANLPAHGHVEGYADWNVLMQSSVSSMRVIHGNSSPLYGDFALAGAVEVFTRADAESTEGAVSATSFGDVRGQLATGRRGARGGFFVGGEGRRVNGWREGSDYWLVNGLARGWRGVGGGRLEGGLGVYTTEWSSPGFVSIEDYNDENFQNPWDPTDGGSSRRAVVHGRFARPAFSEGNLQITGWAMASDYTFFLNIPGHDHGDPAAVQQSGEWDERVAAGGQVEVGWATGSGDIVFGVSGRADDVRYEHALTLDREVVNPEVALDAKHASGAMYGRWRLGLGRRLGVDLGARVDVLRHESRSDLDAAPTWESSTNTVVSPKVGARYRLSDRWYAIGSSARGFRSPVGIIGDPSREPYLSWSHEVGFQRDGGRWSAEVTGFWTNVQNERVLDPVTLQPSGAGESTRRGVDAELEIQLPLRLRAVVGGTWNHARLNAPYVDAHEDHPHGVFDPSDPVGADGSADYSTWVPGLAEYLGRLRIGGPVARRVHAFTTWRLVGPHVPIGEPTVRTQPFSVLDLGAAWTVSEGRTFEVEATNVLGVKYVELRSSGYVSPGAPASLRVQFRVDTLPF